MSIYNLIQQDIQDTIRTYLNLGFIMNPKFSDRCCENFKIANTRTSSGIKDNIEYSATFLDYYSCNDYIFCFLDGSFIQLLYEFKQKDKEQYVSKATLSYYPNPGLKLDDVPSIFNENFSSQNELLNLYINDYKFDEFYYYSNYIRLDYNTDEQTYTELIHPKCHLHIGLNNNFRIGINRVPFLSEFVDFIFYTTYNNYWSQYHTHGDSSEDKVNIIINSINSIKSKRKQFITDSLLTKDELSYYHFNL